MISSVTHPQPDCSLPLPTQLNGVGYLQGLDSRNSTAVARGTGGYLQLASYIAGISGGSWTVGSLAINDWPTPQTLHDSVYDLTDGLFAPPASSTSQLVYYAGIASDLQSKQAAGYQISLIDFWGRTLSGHLVDSQQQSTTNTLQWSDIQNTTSFTSAAYPFPLVTMVQLMSGQTTYSGGVGNGTIWEMNPYESGSWDKGIAAFVETANLGTAFNDGAATACISGFDNL